MDGSAYRAHGLTDSLTYPDIVSLFYENAAWGANVLPQWDYHMGWLWRLNGGKCGCGLFAPHPFEGMDPAWKLAYEAHDSFPSCSL